jgi:hypothetical protein
MQKKFQLKQIRERVARKLMEGGNTIGSKGKCAVSPCGDKESRRLQYMVPLFFTGRLEDSAHPFGNK